MLRNTDSQIVRMLNDINFAKKDQGESGAGDVHGVDLYPALLEKEIDAMNEFVYEKVSHAKVHSDGVFNKTSVTSLRSRAKRQRFI